MFVGEGVRRCGKVWIRSIQTATFCSCCHLVSRVELCHVAWQNLSCCSCCCSMSMIQLCCCHKGNVFLSKLSSVTLSSMTVYLANCHRQASLYFNNPHHVSWKAPSLDTSEQRDGGFQKTCCVFGKPSSAQLRQLAILVELLPGRPSYGHMGEMIEGAVTWNCDACVMIEQKQRRSKAKPNIDCREEALLVPSLYPTTNLQTDWFLRAQSGLRSVAQR